MGRPTVRLLLRRVRLLPVRLGLRRLLRIRLTVRTGLALGLLTVRTGLALGLLTVRLLTVRAWLLGRWRHGHASTVLHTSGAQRIDGLADK
ncbi:hypothetical protein [Streptomyces griseiscabiei]|uniref:hypothetical protein n=1 Tax=Streptomyces griseiscabiei TaxID=2993540 RepID=UPI00117BF4A6|nr:hypothetical protein [Streptomyces griseiscabiei]MBZ3903778.1 hypothetical protein [Streptomyces griseiscabiei]